MCGRDLPPGKIVCESCDKPRRKAHEEPAAQVVARAPVTSHALALDPFPEAPIVQFPVESATPAITSVVNFAWDPAGPRTGRGLFRAREFAVSHGGSVWVDARTGKACTFFLRVRADVVS